MNAATPNHTFRLVWSDRIQSWIAVAEITVGRGKSRSGRAARRLRATAAAVALAHAGLGLAAGGLPTGGQVVAGSASLSQSGATLTVQQSTPRLVTNWESFSIGAGNTVRFVQPGTSSVALNRVLGADVSSIQGALQANGQVFLLNPNGVLFSAGARVDTGGLVASTLNMSDADFLAGRYRLSGNSTAGVDNRGVIDVASGGAVALVAARVVNEGQISADRGQVLLGSGQDVTLDFGGPVRLQVNRGALDGLVANGGAIRADGGTVLLTAKAADALASSVINQTGVIRARTLASGERGEIVLMGDMAHGTLEVGGTLDASAPAGGRGGFIETSAASVAQRADLKVDAGARDGEGGLWLIDPYNYAINASAATSISNSLNGGTSVTVSTQSSNASYGGGASGSGDITVSSAITKSAGADATLTLRADNNIVVNSAITSTSGKLNITLSSANASSATSGGVNVGANLDSNGGRILIGGGATNGLASPATAAQSHGIGYALQSSTATPGVQIGRNVNVLSRGGDITINGRSSNSNSSYDGSKGGVYVLQGATVDTGGGNLYISGISTGANKVFGFAVEAGSNTLTTFSTSSTTGVILVETTNAGNVDGALGLVNNGSQAQVVFKAPSVAHMLFRTNGTNQAATFTYSPPGCGGAFPNCGTMLIPGANGSYLYADYYAHSMPTLALWVTTGDRTRAYNGTNNANDVPTSALTTSGAFNVANLGALQFSTASKDVGSYTSLTSAATNPTQYTSGSSTYAVAYFNQGTYSITPKSLTSFTAANKVYDATTAANVTSSGIVAGDSVTVNTSGSFASSNVGNGISVNVNLTGATLTGADAGNYSFGGSGTITTTANITPAPLTITASNASKTYDGQAYSGGNGVQYSGFVGGQTQSVLGGTLSYGGSAQGGVDAGSYTITPQGLTSSNYAITYANGSLTVNPATLQATLTGQSSKVYDSNTTAPLVPGNYTLSGFVGSDSASVTRSTGAYADANAGTAKSVSSTLTSADFTAGSGTNLANYTLPTSASGNIGEITRAPLTVTANDATKTYDGNAYTGGNGVVYAGFVGGQNQSVLGGTLTYGGTAQNAVNAGSYTITPQGLTSGNYAISFVDGSLTVYQQGLQLVTAALTGATSKVYNGNTTASLVPGNFLLSGFVNGDSATVTRSTGTYADANVGTAKLVTTPLTAGDFSAVGSTNLSNYALPTSASGYIGEITQRTLTMAALGGQTSKVYDGTLTATLAPGNFTLSGFIGNESATVTRSTGTYADANVGTAKSVSATLAAGDFSPGVGTNLANYALPTSASGNIGAITRAPLTVTANNASKTYDGQAYSGGNGVQYSGFANGETASVLGGTLGYGGTSQGAVNTGSYTITPQGLTASNYTISYADGTLTVNPATLYAITAALTGQTRKVYDGNTTATLVPGNFLLSGWVGTDSATVTRSTGTYADADAGSGKLVTTALVPADFSAGAGTNLSNYTLPTSASGNIGTITPATLTVTANTASRTYGASNPSLGGSVSGFVNGQTLQGATSGSLSFASDANATSPVGSHAIVGGGLVPLNGNYVIVQAPGNAGALTITPAPLTVTANSTSKTYDGQAYGGGNGVTYSGFVNGEGAGVLGGTLGYGGSAQGAVNAGSYAITPQGLTAGNYTIVFANGTLTVNPAALTAISTALVGQTSKVYDGNTTATLVPGNFVISGFVGNDSATITRGSGTYADPNVGSGKLVSTALLPSDFLAGTGTNLGNYTLPTSASGNIGTITPAPLTVTANAASRTYGAANPALGGSVSGFVDGQTLQSATSGSLAFSSGAGATSPVGSYAIVGGGLVPLNGNYVLVQAPGNAGALTITPAPLSVTANDAGKIYDGRAFGGGNGVSFTGFVNGESAAVLGGTLGYAGSAQGASNAGSYLITPQGLSSANYAISYTDGHLVISSATLTIAGSAASMFQGGALPALSGTVTGFVNGETLASATTGTLVFTTTADTGSTPGSYAVVGSGLAANHGNYVFAQAAGNGSALTVNAPASNDAVYVTRTTSPVPNFVDNAALALGNQTTVPDAGSLNYIAVGTAPAPSAPVAGMGGSLGSSLGSSGLVISSPAVSGSAASTSSPSSSMLATGAAAGGVDTSRAGTTPANPSATVNSAARPTTPADGAEAPVGSRSVVIAGATVSGTTGDANASATNGTDGNLVSTADAAANPAGAPSGNGGTRTARAGVAGVAVSSANGSLEVLVVNGGINTSGPARPTRE